MQIDKLRGKELDQLFQAILALELNYGNDAYTMALDRIHKEE